MRDAPEHIKDAGGDPDGPGPVQLAAARGTLADIAQHSAEEVQAACRVVLELSDDSDEREDARGLLNFLTSGREIDR